MRRCCAGGKLPTVEIRDASPLQFRGAGSPSPDQPGECDCNCPAHRDGDTLFVHGESRWEVVFHRPA